MNKRSAPPSLLCFAGTDASSAPGGSSRASAGKRGRYRSNPINMPGQSGLQPLAVQEQKSITHTVYKRWRNPKTLSPTFVIRPLWPSPDTRKFPPNGSFGTSDTDDLLSVLGDIQMTSLNFTLKAPPSWTAC